MKPASSGNATPSSAKHGDISMTRLQKKSSTVAEREAAKHFWGAVGLLQAALGTPGYDALLDVQSSKTLKKLLSRLSSKYVPDGE